MKDQSFAAWPRLPISEFAKTSAGGTPAKSNKSFYDGGDIPWLMSGEVSNRDIFAASKFITSEGLAASSAKMFPRDSVLVAMYGATAGEVGILRFEAATNQAVCAIFPGEKHVPEYLYYYLLSANAELVSQAIGNAQPNISQAKVKAVEVPLPPLKEQKRVVAVLDHAFAALDRASANAEANLADSSHLEEVFLNAQIASLFARFGSIRIDQLAAVKGGKRLPKGEKTSIEKTSFPYISVRDMTDSGTINEEKVNFISETVQKTIKRYTISSADIYVSIAGTIAKTGVIPDSLDGANLTENAAKLVLSKGWDRDFVYWTTRSSDFREQAIAQTRTAAQPKLALERLGSITIPKAQLEEQVELRDGMGRFHAEMARAKTIYDIKLRDIADLRQSLLQKAFSGQLTE